MAVVPSRVLDARSDINVMTLDQFVAIHGTNPTRKHIPDRPMGPPRSRSDPYARREAAPEMAAPPSAYQGQTRASYAEPAPVRAAPASSQNGRPKARLVQTTPGVSPTDPTYGGPHKVSAPCRDVLELEVEIEGLGLALYPVECEVVTGDPDYPPGQRHPNQPHMARVPGHVASTFGAPRPTQDVFVGWDDAVRS